MDQEEKKMKPIWYFVGLMLSAMGFVIFVTGIVNFSREGTIRTVLSETHPELWWGAITMVVGLLFLWANRKPKVK